MPARTCSWDIRGVTSHVLHRHVSRTLNKTYSSRIGPKQQRTTRHFVVAVINTCTSRRSVSEVSTRSAFRGQFDADVAGFCVHWLQTLNARRSQRHPTTTELRVKCCTPRLTPTHSAPEPATHAPTLSADCQKRWADVTGRHDGLPVKMSPYSAGITSSVLNVYKGVYTTQQCQNWT